MTFILADEFREFISLLIRMSGVTVMIQTMSTLTKDQLL